MARVVEVGEHRIVGDPAALDMELAFRALSQDSYWARGRTRETHERAFAASRVAVALDRGDATVGFARAVTDGVTHAYLCDVWVEPAHRGRGLGRALVAFLVDGPELRDVRRWCLATNGAEALYEEFGFAAYAGAATWMERRGPTV